MTADEGSARQTLSVADLEAWVRRSAELIGEHAEELTELDAAIGDADHGTNMKRGLAAAVDAVGAGGGFLAWNERLDLGTPFEQVLADYALAHPDRPDWAEILSLYRQRFTASLTGPVAGMASLLDELLKEGVVLYGLTNFDAAPFERARLLVPQLEHFSGIVVSGREHLAKPDDAIFELLLERYGLHAASTLFVDDSMVNIRAAGRLGLRTHHFTGAGRARRRRRAHRGGCAPDRR